MEEGKVCLISGRKIKGNEKFFYFMRKNPGRKFYISYAGLEKNRNMTYGELATLASRHPERGERYEKVGKERLESILKDSVRKNIQAAFAPLGICAG